MRLARARTIKAPSKAIWQAIAPVESMPRWLSGSDKAEHLPGPAEGVGRKQRLFRVISNHDVEIEQEVVAWEPGRLMRVRHLRETSGGRELRGVQGFEMTVLLEPRGDRTRVTAEYTWTSSGLSWLYSLLFAGRIFGRELRDTLKKMDTLVTGG